NVRRFCSEACIKGHRSSHCKHTDRPLFEVKRKGRPVTQCETCRDLRKSKKINAKCICDESMKVMNSHKGKAATVVETRRLDTKYKRCIPVHPTLPNGLKDLLEQYGEDGSHGKADLVSSLRVGSLTNLFLLLGCGCGGDACTCAASGGSCCSTKKSSAENAPSSCCKPGSLQGRYSIRKTKRVRQHSPGPELPPFLFPQDDVITLPPLPTTFESQESYAMPPMSTITSFAGSGCTCGVQCACPGCVEHRGPSTASSSGSRDCGDSVCIHCLFPEVPAPATNTAGHSHSMDSFWKTAASIPPPPENWKHGSLSDVGSLNPFDVSLYPPPKTPTSSTSAVFQLVNLPKLECCGGNCGCPNGSCDCGTACDGCCTRHSSLKAASEAAEKEKAVMSPLAPVVWQLHGIEYLGTGPFVERCWDIDKSHTCYEPNKEIRDGSTYY
ncbi:hypothetical protein DL96DRAFT_1454550, partial [Flagelloscypha sp. PMI_526]